MSVVQLSGQGEEMTLAVGNPAHGGHCVARPVDEPHGRVIFVRGALPGETVRATITEKTVKTWRAEVVEVLAASPDRVQPTWARSMGEVGGAELAHVSLPAQRTWKRWVLADCLRRIGGQMIADAVARLDPARGGTGTASVVVEGMPTDEAALASSDPLRRENAGTGTRTRISLDVAPDGRLGMHGFRSARVMPVDDLPLAVAAIQDLGLVGPHSRALWRRHLRAGQKVSVVAPSVGEPVVLFGQTRLTADGRNWASTRVTEAVDARRLGLDRLHYSVHADGFWQIHLDAPRMLLESVVSAALTGATRLAEASQFAAAASGMRVLELYSGAGLFTVALAALGAQVHSLEGSERAVRDAQRNLRAFDRAQAHVGWVTPAAVHQLGHWDGKKTEKDAHRGADVVILDPSRKGAGKAIMRAVMDLAPQRIVMVSCDPAAAARDLAACVAGGYQLADMRVFDMFPHTHHMETVAVLERP